MFGNRALAGVGSNSSNKKNDGHRHTCCTGWSFWFHSLESPNQLAWIYLLKWPLLQLQQKVPLCAKYSMRSATLSQYWPSKKCKIDSISTM